MLTRLTIPSILALGLAAPALAAGPEDAARAELLTGWRGTDGVHIAAIRISLAPGWKTYWRAPGDAGIPPEFTWNESRNIRAVAPEFPVPEVFWQGGMRSVGYTGDVVFPLAITLEDAAAEAELSGALQIGVCLDVCVPVTARISAVLPPGGDRDASIAAALADRPAPAESAGVGSVRCEIEPISDGLRVTARIDMPPMGGEEVAVLEAADPAIWVSEAEMSRAGGTLTAVADMVPPSGEPFLLDRSGVRITVLSDGRGVDIRGCAGS